MTASDLVAVISRTPTLSGAAHTVQSKAHPSLDIEGAPMAHPWSKVRASLDIKAVFNATGCAADLGRIIRAAFVVGTCTALVLATLAGLSRAHAGTSTACLPSAIKAALAKADAACGIKVISAHRPNARIAGTRHPSMHASCRAADFTSRDYACVYRTLADWPGKMSTDASRAKHVHIDDGRYARFVHGYSRRLAKRKQRVRVARHHGRRG